MVKTIRYVLASVKRHFLSFILIALIAAGASFYVWYRQPACYESTMVCGYNNDRFSRKNYGELFQKLDLLAASHSVKELARQLQLPEAQTAMLAEIKPKNMSGSALNEDITTNYQPFYITVRATGRMAYQGLEQALLAYANRSAYLHEIGAIEVRKIEAKIAFMQQDLARIDSTIDSYSQFLRHTISANDSVGGFANIKALFAYKDELEDKLTSMAQRRDLQQQPSVVMLHGFAPSDQPARGERKNMWAGIMAGIALAVAWAVYRNASRDA